MAKYPYASIILTMLLSFTVSFAFMYWHGEPKASAIPETLPATSVVEPPSPRPAPLANARSPLPVSGPQAPSHAQARADSSTAAAEEPVPVDIQIWNRRHKGKVEGRIHNTSDHPLSVTILGRNSSGEQTAQLMLDLTAGEEKSFGTDQGMDLHESDQIVVSSAGYQNKESAVP